MNFNLKKSLVSFAVAAAIGTMTLSTSGMAFADTQTSAHNNMNNSYATSVGSSSESSHFDGANHDLFNAVTTQSFVAPTGVSTSMLNLDASKGYVANVAYNKAVVWADTSGTEVNSNASQAASGFGYTSEAANFSKAKVTSSASGTATVAVAGHVAAEDSIHVAQSTSNSPDGSNSSSSTIQSSKTGEVSGTNSTNLTWNNSTSSQNSSGASQNSSTIPTFTWDATTGTWTRS